MEVSRADHRIYIAAREELGGLCVNGYAGELRRARPRVRIRVRRGYKRRSLDVPRDAQVNPVSDRPASYYAEPDHSRRRVRFRFSMVWHKPA